MAEVIEMTKKDYERAAQMVQDDPEVKFRREVTEFLVDFFAGDNPRFDAERFQRACEPGANVRARSRQRVTS